MATYNIYQAIRDYMQNVDQPNLADICQGINRAPGTVAPILRVLTRNGTVTKTGRGHDATYHHKSYDEQPTAEFQQQARSFMDRNNETLERIGND